MVANRVFLLNINELTACEVELMKVTSKLDDTATRVEANQDARLDDMWQEVVDGYLGLIDDSIFGPEAIKRALFLVWYSYNEPAFLTGLGALSNESEDWILKRIERTIGTNDLDEATHAMVGGYGWGMPFELHSENYQTALFLKKKALQELLRVDLGAMDNRGMMGKYWLLRLDEERELQSAKTFVEDDQDHDSSSVVLETQKTTCPRCGVASRTTVQNCSSCGWHYMNADDFNAEEEEPTERWLERPLNRFSFAYCRTMCIFGFFAILFSGRYKFLPGAILLFLLVELTKPSVRGP